MGRALPTPYSPPLERVEQASVTRLLTAAGFCVRSTSQYRPARIAVGIPDLILHHRALGRGGWFEVKRYRATGYHPGRRDTWHPEPRSPEQVRFAADAEDCGQLYGWGGLHEAETLLVVLGLAVRAAHGLVLQPPRYRNVP